MSQADTRADALVSSDGAGAPLALNYALMRSAMIQWVQELAGDRWTNYNESDPGVTILEQLCFVMTELGLRADRPIPELLASTQSLRIQLQRQGLYDAPDILPGPALTLADQRRWLLDQVPEAANLWLTPLLAGPTGLLRAEVLPRLPEMEGCLCASEVEEIREELAQQVKRAAARLRNLGEDLAEVVVLEPQPVAVSAKVTINSQRHPDEIQAEMLFRLGLHLAPEPRRHSLEDCLKAGRTPAAVYQGPPMLRGFLADEDLASTIKPPSPRDLREIMASVSGVLEVEDLRIVVEQRAGRSAAVGAGIVAGFFPHLQVDLQASPPPLRLSRDGHLSPCNPERVKRLLKRHWQDHRQSYNLEQGYLQAFPPLIASSVEDGSYASIQTIFPAVYGLSAESVDASASPKRQGQIKQLKGYLMIFDQLLADFAAQLAALRDLFSPRVGGERTTAFRSLRQVPGCSCDLLVSQSDAKQADLNAGLEARDQRQALILDFFLAMYGQSLLPLAADNASPSGQAIPRSLLQAKEELLNDVVRLSRERGGGVNYREGVTLGAPTALERRCALELRARGALEDPGAVVLETDPEKATFGRLLSAEASRRVRETFLLLDGLISPLKRAEEGDREARPFFGKTVAAALWPALAQAKSYRIGGCDSGEDVDLVCFDAAGGCWWLGSFANARSAHAFAHQLLTRAGTENDAVCLVEWVLLRHALRHAGADALEARWFDSRVSIVVMRPQATPALQETLTTVLRPHLPAHLEMVVHVYGPRRFARFLDLRDAWLRSLAGDDPERQASTSHRLAMVLLDGAAPAPSALAPASEPAPEAKLPAEAEVQSGPCPPEPALPPTAPVAAGGDQRPTGATPVEKPPLRPEAAAEAKPPAAAEAQPFPSASASEPAPPPMAPVAAPADQTAPGATPLESPPLQLELWPEAELQLELLPLAGAEAEPAPQPEPVPEALPLAGGEAGAEPPPPSPPDPVAGPQQEPEPERGAVPAPAVGPPVRPPSPIGSAPSLPLLVVPAVAGAEGVRCDTPVERASLRRWRTAGLRFLLRPLPWTASPGGALSPEELGGLLREGWALMTFQEASIAASDAPMDVLGQRHGEAAVRAARGLGLPDGLVIWLAGTPPAGAADPPALVPYLTRWTQAIRRGGYGPGLFMTPATPLTNLNVEWLCRTDPAVTPPMLGFGLLLDRASPRQERLAGQGELLRIARDRRGQTPNWLALDPRALPPITP